MQLKVQVQASHLSELPLKLHQNRRCNKNQQGLGRGCTVGGRRNGDGGVINGIQCVMSKTCLSLRASHSETPAAVDLQAQLQAAERVRWMS